MDADIRIVPTQRVLCAERTGEVDRAVKESWDALYRFANPRGLWRTDVCYGVSGDEPADLPAGHIVYVAAVPVPDDLDVDAAEVSVRAIGGGRHAVFVHRGAHAGLGETYRRIVQEWLPASGLRPRKSPTFERYRDETGRAPGEAITEIFVPIE